MQTSVRVKIRAVMLGCNEEEFKKIYDLEKMFIRETELIKMDTWIANVEEFSLSGAYTKKVRQGYRTLLVH